MQFASFAISALLVGASAACAEEVFGDKGNLAGWTIILFGGAILALVMGIQYSIAKALKKNAD